MMSKSTRIPELEALRGVAAISVLYFHYTFFFRSQLNYDFNPFFDFKYGHHGVELFFMISGFVIFMSLETIKSVKEFLYKRFIRLYPTYWICLSITLFVLLFNNTDSFQVAPVEKILNVLMFHGLFYISNVDGSYWSLLHELLFYALMITLWKLSLLQKIELICLLWLALMYAAFLRPSIIDIVLNLKFGVFFIIGILFNLLYQNNKNRIAQIILVIALVSVFVIQRNLEVFLFTCFFASVFYLLIYNKLSFLNTPILIFLGKVSYPLYLIHQTVGFILIYNLMKAGLPHFGSILVTMAFVIGLSFLIYEYLEKPILKKFK
ncbi:acyltransferase family protein [Flavobacterium turcicum]|uniref:Acyltransferase n=1 Tax=Flavobacterium turcicum TaxID=2764718 RepID=A0ABR7JI97_9FLAO|nr:acyltransferase [Flavobacterium turcicum]MBC5864223.1 acyltransferase [Flavobacterium turcicum]NHL03131.1 acyltransferase [Flavobacterium turcicum]